MVPETLTAQVERDLQILEWSPATRVGFRFCFVYFGLFCLFTQIISNLFSTPYADLPDPSTLPPMRQIVIWTAEHIFGVKTTLSLGGNSGSGDNLFAWVLVFCLLVIAAVATVVWSRLDRGRENYNDLHKWFRLFLRFALAGQMFAYGMAKVIPTQMPFPQLTRLVEPFGDFSPMGVLWYSIGAAPAYEIFAGCAEVLGGLLLIFPRTTTLGALVCLADMTQVFTLNMTYDVPVKLFSFHLLLLSLLLLAPALPHLINLFFLNRAAHPVLQRQLFRTPRANRIALTAQIVIGLWLIGLNAYGGREIWKNFGGGRANSALYGIWDISQISVDDQPTSPILTGKTRWRRAIFDAPTRVAFQKMDDAFVRYGVTINVADNTLALTKDSDKNWKSNFTFKRAAPDQLVMDGDMDGHKMHMDLQLQDRNKFMLVSRGFHWIQEFPFNR